MPRLSRKQTCRATRSVPEVRFEEQQLSSFGGLVILEAMLRKMGFNDRLRSAVDHVTSRGSYTPVAILRTLIVHLFLGWRRLRDLDYYPDDPLATRTAGVERLPDVATMSRRIASFDERAVDGLRQVLRDLVGKRATEASPSRLTIDFDGSLQSTRGRRIEGTAIGYNKIRRGAHSYYPLLATVAQTSQVFDVVHRAGNCHDSRDALEFVKSCVTNVRSMGFQGVLEARFDAAHYSDAMCNWMDENGIEFSISVPFERIHQMRGRIHATPEHGWTRIDDDHSFFAFTWSINSKSKQRYACYAYRQVKRSPHKGPVQLDLFEPRSSTYEYKVVVTNKELGGRALLEFHNGRCSQETMFSELKPQFAMNYVPSRRLIGNQVYLLSGLIAHALTREMQMQAQAPRHLTNTPKRACLWALKRADSLRRSIIQRAARITRPAGKNVVTMASEPTVERDFRELARPWGLAA